MIKKVCPICKKEFDAVKNRIIYCSKKCANVAKKKPNTIVILDNYAEIVINSKKWGERRALISINDVEKVKNMTWQVKYTKSTNCFYVHSSQCYGKSILLHRFITDCPDNKIIDHINHNPLDNRRENLRMTTSRGNSLNIKIKKNNVSGLTGVRLNKNGKYDLYFCKKYIGTYKKIEQAKKIREKLLKKEIQIEEKRAVKEGK